MPYQSFPGRSENGGVTVGKFSLKCSPFNRPRTFFSGTIAIDRVSCLPPFNLNRPNSWESESFRGAIPFLSPPNTGGLAVQGFRSPDSYPERTPAEDLKRLLRDPGNTLTPYIFPETFFRFCRDQMTIHFLKPPSNKFC